MEMEQSLGTSQASYEIEPRVFYEDFHNYVLYVQDVRSGTGAANWRQVFMADVSDPNNPLITTAASATVVTDNTQELLMRLRDGVRDETVADAAGTIEYFDLHDHRFAADAGPAERRAPGAAGHRSLCDAAECAVRESINSRPDAKRFLIELHNRFAFPAACLVLMLVGVPLGVASRRGGKSSGFVFTILLVFVYYFLSSTGIALGHQNKLPAFPGGLVGEFVVCRGGHVSAVADGDRRADFERYSGVDCTDAETSGRGETRWIRAYGVS